MVISRTANSSYDGGQDSGNPSAKVDQDTLGILTRAAYSDQPSKGASGGSEGLKRASSVLAGGLADGMINGVNHALENKWETTTHLAESFAVGYGLNAVSKMGKLGAPAAAAAGLGMGAVWAWSEVSAGRPQAAIGALTDAYNSGANLEQDRKKFAASGGAMAFDTTLALAGGVAGFKTAGHLKANWQTEAIGAVKNGYNNGLDFLSRSPGDMGRAFAGKDVHGPFEQIRDLTSGKTKQTGSLQDLQAHLERTRLGEDKHILDIQARMREATQNHGELSAQETATGTKIARLSSEREAIARLTTETEQVQKAQRDLASTFELNRSIPGKEQEVARLAKEAETARGRVRRELDEDGRATPEKIAADAKTLEHERAKADLDGLKEMAGPDAVERARQKLVNSQTALEQARAKQPEALQAKEAELAAARLEMAELTARRTSLNDSATALIAAHVERMNVLQANPSLFIQGEKPVIVKEQVAPPKLRETRTDKPAPEASGGTAGEATAQRVVAEPLAAQPEVKATTPEPVKQDVAPQITDKTGNTDKVGSPDKVAVSAELSQARDRAFKAVRENELSREIQSHRQTLTEIEQGTYKPSGNRTIDEVRQSAEQNIARAQDKLGTDSPASYTRAIKTVGEYARSVSREMARINNAEDRGAFAVSSVETLEAMMNRLPNAYKGFKGQLADISPVRSGASPEARLNEIQQHLEAKAKLLDGSRNKQLEERAEQNPVLADILNRSRGGELPEDGTIVLFGQDGKFLHPQGSRSPHFIEVRRLNEHGVGADGGGFNRFINEGDNIAGGAILRPVYKDGVPVEVPSRSASGKPVYKKEIVGLFGSWSEAIQVGDNFVKILEKLKPSQN